MSRYIDNIMRNLLLGQTPKIITDPQRPKEITPTLVHNMISMCKGNPTTLFIPRNADIIVHSINGRICGLKIMDDMYDIILSYYIKYGGEWDRNRFLLLAANCQYGVLGSI